MPYGHKVLVGQDSGSWGRRSVLESSAVKHWTHSGPTLHARDRWPNHRVLTSAARNAFKGFEAIENILHQISPMPSQRVFPTYTSLGVCMGVSSCQKLWRDMAVGWTKYWVVRVRHRVVGFCHRVVRAHPLPHLYEVRYQFC